MADRFCISSGDFNSTSIWSTSSGGASGASVPGINDAAIFDTGAFAVSTSQVHSIDQLKLLTGYTGTLDLTGFDFTSDLVFILESGTVKFPSTGTFESNGIDNTVGGTLTPGATGTYKLPNNSSNVSLLIGNGNFHTIRVDTNGNVNVLANEFVATSLLWLKRYNFIGGEIIFEGDCDIDALTTSSSTGKIIARGTANQTMRGVSAGGLIPNFRNDKTAGTLTFVSRINTRNGWTDLPTGTAISDYGTSTIDLDVSGTVDNKFKFFDLLTTGQGSYQFNDIVVSNDFTLQSSNQVKGTITVEGNFINNDATYQTGSTLKTILKGNRLQNLTQGVTADSPNGKLDLKGKTQKLLSDINWLDSSFGLPDIELFLNSVLNLNNFALAAEDVFDISGFIHVSDGGSFTGATVNKKFGFMKGNANSLRNQSLTKRNQSMFARNQSLGRRLMEVR